ncbi:MAG: hypothetical protein IPN42_11945 [Methylococcaceae bacterium]|nr:hypothetical protein [Methylococcaceae bacterium]
MKLSKFLMFVLSLVCLNAQAGNLMNGQWQAANCGQKPPSPTINTKSVDAFNQSIKDINAWQAKAQEYYNCIVKEANIDNQIIATTANSAQDEFKNEVNRIQKEAEAGKAKVEKD